MSVYAHEEMLNRGIPVVKPIGLSLEVVANQCTTNRSKFEKVLLEKVDELNEYFIEETEVVLPIASNHFSFGLDSDLDQHLIFDPLCVYYSVGTFLNLPEKMQFESYSEIKKTILERCKILKRTNNEKVLEKEFPEIYMFYQSIKEVKNDYENINKQRKALTFFNKLNNTLEDLENQYNKDIELLDKYGFRWKAVCLNSIKDLILENVHRVFKSSNRYLCEEKISQYIIELEDFEDCIDFDKLELLIVASHLSAAYKLESHKQENISYVTDYITNNKNILESDVSITAPKFDDMNVLIEVTPKVIYQYYKEFLVKNPDIKIINVDKSVFNGMTEQQVREYVNNYVNEIEASWDFLESDDIGIDADAIRSIRNSNEHLSEEDRRAKIEHLEEMYLEKREYFAKLNPYARIKGKEKFDGYVGYIFLNGKVVLEKFFENYKTKRVAEANAIYIMNIEDFIEFSKLSKTILMENNNINRVIHKGAWQEKVSSYLELTEENYNVENIKRIAKTIK